MLIRRSASAICFTLAVAFSMVTVSPAQSALSALRPVTQTNRVPANADFLSQTRLANHLPEWVTGGAQVASKSVDISAPLRISIVLRRDPAVQAAFVQLLADQQNPSSPLYHQWLTPQQVGTLFGPTASDLAAVTSWLTAQGLSIDAVSASKVIIDVHGSTAVVGNAFRTSFAYYDLNEAPHLSAVSQPSIPTVLKPIIDSIHGLTQLPIMPQSILSAPHSGRNTKGSSVLQPELTNGTDHFLTPNDFATIFDINSVYTAGNKGATIGTKAQHVAIMGESRVATTDISEFAANTAIVSYTLNTIIPTGGADPGAVCTTANASTCPTSGVQGEATLDVDRVIGTAPGAQVDLVTASAASGGIYVAAQYNVNTLLDSVMTISFGACERNVSASSVNLWDTVFSAGAAEGISTFVSSGDSGANGCATSFVKTTTAEIASMNYICSSTYATCVGGTEFADTTSPSTYWSTNNGTGGESALSYIPEGGWNEPSESCSTGSNYCPGASGGGASIYITKPSWQVGTNVPADGARDTPDVSYPSAGHDGFYACLDYALGPYIASGQAPAGSSCINGGYFFGFSGTSAAAPSMAGVAALLNTKLAAAQGNLNPLLYRLAASTSSPFHDITVASSGVSGCSITVPSVCNNSTPGASANSATVAGGVEGFLVGTGYDEVTGLGSLDVANFLTAASATTTVTTTLALTVAPNPATTSQSVTLTATLTPGTSSKTPSGTVQFYSAGVAIGSAVTIASNVATLNYTFTTAGTFAITAVYSGDTNFSTSSATAVSLVVNAPVYTVTPTTLTYNLISGATTGNTDNITVTSLNSFAGSVALTCAVTSVSGTAAGSCSLGTSPLAITSGGSLSSLLTITTTPGTSGVLSVKVTGTNGSNVIPSGAITVNLTAASFTMAASTPVPATVTSGNSATSTVTLASVNGFAGSVALTCSGSLVNGNSSTSTTCTVATPVTLIAGGTATAAVTIPTTYGAGGVLTATISGTGTTAGSTIAFFASPVATAVVTVTAPSFTLTPTNTTLSFNSGATTGNTDTITVASVNAYVGPVSFTCAMTSSSPGFYAPTCAVPSATLTSGGTTPATLTITSTLATTSQLDRRWPFGGSGVVLAALFFIPAIRRRRSLRSLATLAILLCGIASLTGCGGSSTPVAPTPKSSAGSYTATITGTGTATGSSTAVTATTTVAVTIH